MTVAPDSIKLEKSDCPLCSGPQTDLLFGGLNADAPDSTSVPIRRCSQCQIVFSVQDKSVSAEGLYYESYYGENKSDKFPNSAFIWLYQKERQATALKNIEPGKILDIGCGDGTFLENLPVSWEKYGFEPAQAGIEASLLKQGINLVNLDDCSSKFGSGFFSVITLWQTLEHVEDPKELLRKISKLLKKDGILFISIPNFDSLQSRIFASRWFHLDPTRHSFHWTKSTINSFLVSCGFEIRKIETLSIEYGVFGWWQSIFNFLTSDFNLGYKILKGRFPKGHQKPGRCTKFVYLILAFPVALISLILTLAECLLGRGSVLNISAVKLEN